MAQIFGQAHNRPNSSSPGAAGFDQLPTGTISRRAFLKGSFAFVLGGVARRFLPLESGEGHLPTETKRIYLALDDHTDYMWSADEATYRQAFLEMLDYYLDLADAHASQPAEHQSRFNCDGSFWLWTYEKNRASQAFKRLIERIRDGHISAPLNALVLSLGGAPAEAVLRGMYYAGRLERREGLRFRIAAAMENQTLPYGLGALWAGAGARYSWRGICGCATQVANASDREHDIYWWVGQDGSRILMKWNSMLISSQGMGGYAEAYDPAGIVDYVDGDAGFRARYPYPVIGAFGKGWDALKTLTGEFVGVAQDKTTAARQVIVSNEEDFFEDFEASYGASLPSLAASFGNEWELYCASLAETSASVKRSVEKLRSAEALAALVSLKTPGFMEPRQTARDQAWMNLGLYWEHDWTADGPVSRADRAAWQRRIAGGIQDYVDSLYAEAGAALGGQIQKSGKLARFFVFNPLSWARTDLAELPFDGAGPVHVIDLETGLETPAQIVTVGGETRLRILARAIPASGYKVFEIRPGAGQGYSPAASVTGGVIENEFYRLALAGNGAITSLIDKTRAGREFVRTVGGRTANDLGPGSGVIAVENAGPVSVTVKATASGPLAHTTRITFLRGSDRIDIRNVINENFDAVYTWAYGFNLDHPDTWHEEVGAVIRARLSDQGGHYSPRNARYDWLTLNHFVDLSAGGNGVTLSNADCYYMKLGESTAGSLDTGTPQVSVLVGGQVDGPALGIPAQGGDSSFLQRFALRTHGVFKPAEAIKFALEHQNPLVAGPVTGGQAYPEKSFSLLSLTSPGGEVLLWALKPAEEGPAAGLIARLWNLAASPSGFTLEHPGGMIAGAQQVTHIETPLQAVATPLGVLAGSLTASQLVTYSFQLEANPPPPPPEKDHLYLPMIPR